MFYYFHSIVGLCFLYCKGDMPVSFLKAREKYEMLLNPQLSLISVTDRSASQSNSFAMVTRVFSIYCITVKPIFSLKSLQK
jgi:hypothetical protein